MNENQSESLAQYDPREAPADEPLDSGATQTTPQQASEQKPAARRSLKPTTPFDYPLVSPIFLLVLAVWFGHDGWFNPDTKSVMFNRVVFGFLLVGSAWTLSVDLKIMKIQRQRKQAAETP